MKRRPTLRDIRRRNTKRRPLAIRCSLEQLESRQLMAADFAPDDLGEYIRDELQEIQSSLIGAQLGAVAIPLLGNQLPDELQIFPQGLFEDLANDLEELPKSATHLQVQYALQNIFQSHSVNVESLSVDENFEVTFQIASAAIQQQLISQGGQLGIHFLPIEIGVAPSIHASVGFELAPVTISYHEATQTFTHEFNGGQDEELIVSMELSLEGTTIDASFGLSQFVTVTDTGSSVNLELGLDIDGGMTLSKPSTDIDLQLTFATNTGSDDADSFLPALPGFAFDLNWQASGSSWSGSDVHLNNVRVELGGLLNTILGPVLTFLEPVLDPVSKAVGFLADPIPVISDLTNQDISILDVLDFAGQHEAFGQYSQFIDTVIATVELADAFGEVDVDDLGNVELNLGDYSLSGSDLQSQQAGLLSSFDGTAMSSVGVAGLNAFDINQIADQIEAHLEGTPLEQFGEDLKTQLTSLNNGFGYEFPIIEEPKNLVYLLLGQPDEVDFFSLSAFFAEGLNDYQEGFQTPFHAGLHAGLVFDVDPILNLKLGYDAVGLFNAIGYQNASFMTDGLWLGKVVDEYPIGVQINGSIGAQLGVTHLVFDAYIEGEVTADLSLTVPEPEFSDGDEKIRLASELGPTLFEVSGGIGGAINIGFQVGIKLFGQCVCTGEEWTLAKTPTAGFSVDAIPNPFDQSKALQNPNLAVLQGDQLVLSVGQDRINNDRQINPDQTAETFLVFVDDDQLVVSISGVEESFALADVASIYADAGDQDDMITIDPSVPVDATIYGGEGNDTLVYQGSGEVSLFGDNGNDFLSGDGAINTLQGGTGIDQLSGGTSPWVELNILSGGDDDDLLVGGSGVNNLYGNAGNDQLEGGSGQSNLSGGQGNDRLIAGAGDAFLSGETGDDQYFTGEGYGEIYDGGSNTDTDRVHWTAGNGNVLIQESAGRTELALLGSEQDESYSIHDGSEVSEHILIDTPGGNWIQANYIEVLSVDAAAGTDTIWLASLSSPTLEFVGFNGSDKLTSDGDSDQIYVATTKGNDDLTISAHDATTQVIDHSNPLFGSTMVVDGLNYLVTAVANPEDNLQLDTHNGDDIIDVFGTTGGLQINTHSDDDVITLFVDETGNTGFPNPVPIYQSPVNVDAGGEINKVHVISQASQDADTFYFSDSGISSDKFTLNYEGSLFSKVTLFGTQVDDTIYVHSTRSEADNLIRGGLGSDQIIVGQDGSLSGIRGLLTVEGEQGMNDLILDDSAAQQGNHDVVIQADTVTGLAGNDDDATIEFSDVTVEIFGSADASVAEVFRLETPVVPLTIHGSAGPDTVVGDALPYVWHLTGEASGSVYTGDGSVVFDGIDNLQGGNDTDYFIMHPGGQLSGSIDGGGDADVLSYTLYTTDVSVDLAASVATALASVQAIEKVWSGSGDDRLFGDDESNQLDGGDGNDVLVGRGGNDILIGGSGRDLLIGGADADTLQGGTGEDILIGGQTTYDDHQASLDAIMAEWTRTDHSRSRRIRYLTYGGGSNGKVVLNSNTVLDDGDDDQLNGEKKVDWVFAELGNQLSKAFAP